MKSLETSRELNIDDVKLVRPLKYDPNPTNMEVLRAATKYALNRPATNSNVLTLPGSRSAATESESLANYFSDLDGGKKVKGNKGGLDGKHKVECGNLAFTPVFILETSRTSDHSRKEVKEIIFTELPPARPQLIMEVSLPQNSIPIVSSAGRTSREPSHNSSASSAVADTFKREINDQSEYRGAHATTDQSHPTRSFKHKGESIEVEG